MAKIVENHEPLVDLEQYCPHLIINLDKNRLDERTAYARKTVAKKLKRAIELLPKNLTFRINDAWRPRHVQEQYFVHYTRYLSKKHPSWSKTRLHNEVSKYVHPATGIYASGHLTGGAIDIVIVYKNSGKKLALRSNKLSFQENAISHQDKLPDYILRNRKIMTDVLINVGFVNYPKEYWHWSYGDIYWAEQTNQPHALYGIINNPHVSK